jgi:hypothetical protein
MYSSNELKSAASGLHNNHKVILKTLQVGSPISLDYFSSIKKAAINLEKRGLIEIRDSQIFLLPLGKALLEEWQNPTRSEKKVSPVAESRRKNSLEKSNQILELYKQGHTYQEIGNEYGLSRERIRQILKKNPGLSACMKEREDLESLAEEERIEREKQEFHAKSLAVMYPERVAELWDSEKNGDLQPSDISA